MFDAAADLFWQFGASHPQLLELFLLIPVFCLIGMFAVRHERLAHLFLLLLFVSAPIGAFALYISAGIDVLAVERYPPDHPAIRQLTELKAHHDYEGINKWADSWLVGPESEVAIPNRS